MTGIAQFVQPDFTSQDPTTYKTSIDGAVAVLARIAAAFSVHEQAPQAMGVTVSMGSVILNGQVSEVAAQDLAIGAAPVTSGYSRIDRVVLDNAGAASVVTGVEGTSPVAPAVPAGYVPLARVTVAYGYTAITNADIDDERVPGSASAGGGFTTEVDLASASTTDLSTATWHLARITGTTTITSFGSGADTGMPVYMVRFASALTITYNATSMQLPGQANITTAAGDTLVAQYLGSGNWRVAMYQKASGLPLASGTPSATTFLRGDGAWAMPAMTLLDTQVASTSTSLDFTSHIDSTYSSYVFELINIKPTSGDKELRMLFSTDGGSSYLRSNYNWQGLFFILGTGFSTEGAVSAAYIQLSKTTGGNAAVGNDTGVGFNGKLTLHNPSGAQFKPVTGECMYGNGFANMVSAPVFAENKTTTAVNAVRFAFNGANIASGTIKMYGIV